MQSLIPTFPPMGKAKKQRAKQRARDRGNPMASVADAGIEGAPTEAAVAKRYEGVESLDVNTRDEACGAIASLFFATGEHGTEAERAATYAARLRVMRRVGMVKRLIGCLTDPHMPVRRNAAGALRNMAVVGGAEFSDYLVASDMMLALNAALDSATSDAAFGTGAPPELAATVEQILELCAHCLEASPGAVRGLVQGGGHRPLTRCLQPGASALGPVPDLAAQCLFIALDDNPELAAALDADAPCVTALEAVLSAATSGTASPQLAAYVAGAVCSMAGSRTETALGPSARAVLASCLRTSLLDGCANLAAAHAASARVEEALAAARASAEEGRQRRAEANRRRRAARKDGETGAVEEEEEEEGEGEAAQTEGSHARNEVQKAEAAEAAAADAAATASSHTAAAATRWGGLAGSQRVALEVIANAGAAAAAEREGEAPGPASAQWRGWEENGVYRLLLDLLAPFATPQPYDALPESGRAALYAVVYRGVTAAANALGALHVGADAGAVCAAAWAQLVALARALSEETRLLRAAGAAPGEAGLGVRGDGRAEVPERHEATIFGAMWSALSSAERLGVHIPIKDEDVGALRHAVSNGPEPGVRAGAVACVGALARLPTASPDAVGVAADATVAALDDTSDEVVAEALHALYDTFADVRRDALAARPVEAPLRRLRSRVDAAMRAKGAREWSERVAEAYENVGPFLDYISQ